MLLYMYCIIRGRCYDTCIVSYVEDVILQVLYRTWKCCYTGMVYAEDVILQVLHHTWKMLFYRYGIRGRCYSTGIVSYVEDVILHIDDDEESICTTRHK